MQVKIAMKTLLSKRHFNNFNNELISDDKIL